MTNRIQREIEQARQKLLDLGLRNRLINFRPTKRRTIKVVEESPREIYDILVLKNRSMSFRAAEKQAELLQETDEVPGFTEDEASKVWVLPPPDAKIPRHHIDTQLETSLEASELQRRLFYIYQQSRSFLEEQGYTTLYLALGFLRWKERPEDDEYRRAPLILVPVDLERTGTRRPFTLKWTEEDISTNISLQAKLNDQHGISLPEFDMPEEKEGIDKYFESVQRKIRSQAEWDVIEDIYLSSFSFAKFLMYKYLDPANWPDDRSLANHPLLREIFSRDPSMPDHLPGFDPESADETPIRNTYHVLDADSSQIAVIEDIKAGRNIVVQGPPGTGKSQTIANTIGELMAQGKKVLFVSEKMAALEVVKSRLDQAGLGDFCLELHSRKTSRKNFIERLKKVFEYHTPPESRSWEQEFRRLERLRESLNGYAKALRIKIGEVGCTVFDLHGMHEKAVRHFERSGFEFPRVDIEKPELVTEDNLFEAKEELRVLADMLDIVDKPLSNNPWRGCEPGTILPGQEEELTKLIGDCRGSLQNLKGRIDKLIELTGLHEPDTKEALLQSIEASKVMADSMPIDSRILLSDYWDQPSEMTRIMGKVKEFQSRKAEMLETFKESALDKNNIDSILTEYKPFAEKFFRWFYARYRRLKK